MLVIPTPIIPFNGFFFFPYFFHFISLSISFDVLGTTHASSFPLTPSPLSPLSRYPDVLFHGHLNYAENLR